MTDRTELIAQLHNIVEATDAAMQTLAVDSLVRYHLNEMLIDAARYAALYTAEQLEV